MKPKVNKQRRAGNKFHAVHQTGYIVYYERAGDGGWGAHTDQLMLFCGARTLRQVKVLVSDGIETLRGDSAAEGWAMPAPQRPPLVTQGS
jgi:hypothetical protein